MKKKREAPMSPSLMIAIGFALLILLVTLLLMLPISSQSRTVTPPLTALFTATSAVCVTGLVAVDTGTTFSLFGQLTLLWLIQIGGLGFMAFATLTMVLLGRKIGLRDRMLLREELSRPEMRLLHRHAVDHRIGTREINILEQTQRVRLLPAVRAALSL